MQTFFYLFFSQFFFLFCPYFCVHIDLKIAAKVNSEDKRNIFISLGLKIQETNCLMGLRAYTHYNNYSNTDKMIWTKRNVNIVYWQNTI